MIAEIQPDVIGLQEVIRAEGAADADQPAYLASKLSMTVIMGATRPSGSGSFGNAILTRLPVIASTAHDLSHGRYERRGCLRVDLAADGAIVHVFNCHFGRRFKERREQLTLLAALLAVTDVQGPRVLVGDFNEWHRGPITRGLRREFPSLRSRVCRTFPVDLPDLRARPHLLGLGSGRGRAPRAPEPARAGRVRSPARRGTPPRARGPRADPLGSDVSDSRGDSRAHRREAARS